MKKWLFFLLKLTLTGVCLAWALKGVDWEDSVLSRPAEIEWGWILPGLGLSGLTILLTAIRLWVLLNAQRIRIGLWRSVELTLIGNLFNLVTVGGVGGDAARIFLLIRDHPERKLAVTLTILFDHLVGMVAMSLVFFALTAGRFDALATQSVETKGILRFAWLFFTGGLVMVLLLFLVSSPPVHNRIHAPGRRWKMEAMKRIPEVYDVYRKQWGRVLVALVAAVVMLPVYYASFWCGVRAAGGEVALAPVLAAMPVVDALSGLPLSVGGVGVREASMKILMKDLTGMESAVAIAGSLIGFCFSLVWALVGALLFIRPKDRASVQAIEELTASQNEED